MSEAVVDAVVVLDDDPTGAQALARVRVLFAWRPEQIARALAGRRAVHLLTNARALPPEAVGDVVASGARAALAAAPAAHVVLRGDSTLRGHLREELVSLTRVVDPGGQPPVLLVPALPAAGRVTIGGVHMIEREGVRARLDATEYARDGVFTYSDSRLLAWAEERTLGLLPAAAGRELHLGELRDGGAAQVAAIIEELHTNGSPAAFAPDAETLDDLRIIADGYVRAHAHGARAIVRCAPAFVGVLSGTLAPGPVEAPRSDDGVLVVCGSYVPTTTRQLARLLEKHPGALVETDVVALASGSPEAEVARAAAEASRVLRRRRLAVVSTPRTRPPGTTDLQAGDRIARGLAAVVAACDPLPRVIVAKGGITSHVTLHIGLGVEEAEVVGPVLPGVSRWQVDVGGAVLEYVVVPGNVGDDDLLATLVRLVL